MPLGKTQKFQICISSRHGQGKRRTFRERKTSRGAKHEKTW
nr:MAG TPA: hypothetical protein [Caudoviricetes sp.]